MEYINYDILSITNIDNLYQCNIDKYDFSTLHINKIYISGLNESIFVYIEN